MRKAFVILNSAAGTLAKAEAGKPAETIRAAFAARDVPCEIREVDGPGVGPAAAEALASDCDVVLAGGGDGTLNSIASALVGTDKVFGLLQLGTLNHLAKELNTPPDLTACVNALIDGAVEPLPIGKVNDRYFLLFSAIGLYAHVVKHRDAQRKALGRSKWPAMAVAFARLLKRFRLQRVRIVTPAGTVRHYTPTVYVALSPYQEALISVKEPGKEGGRSTLRVHVARATGRAALLRLVVRAALGKLRPEKDFETVEACSFSLEVAGRTTRVGIDGEVIDLPTPLKFELLIEGLNVLRPRVAAAI